MGTSEGNSLFAGLNFYFRIFLYVSFISGAIVPGSNAQTQLFLPLSKMGLEKGLSSPNIRKIVQDKYGFMWFGTQDGLNRFDGINFIHFNAHDLNSKRSLSGSDVYDLQLDPSGNFIWVLTAYGGLDKVDVTSCSLVGRLDIPSISNSRDLPWFKCMDLGSNYLFIANNEGIIYRYNLSQSKFDQSVDISNQFGKAGPIDEIFIDRFERVWIFIRNTGILITDIKLNRNIHFISKEMLGGRKEKDIFFNDFLEKGDTLLIATNIGLKVYDLNTLQPTNVSKWLPGAPSFFENGDLHCVNSTHGESILISGNNGLYQVKDASKKWERILFSRNYEDQKWLALTHSLYQTEQSIWIGSQYGLGWIKNVESPFTGYFTSMDQSKTRIEHSTPFCPINDSLVVACADDGLYLANLVTAQLKKFGLKDFYFFVYRIHKNYILASSVDSGSQLYDLKGNRKSLHVIFPELDTLENDLLVSAASYKDSLVFFASQNAKGMYIWDMKKHKVNVISSKSAQNALKSNIINRLYLDSSGKLWIICDNAISIYDPALGKMIDSDIKSGLSKKILSIGMDICEHRGRYWLAVYGLGIVELGKNRNILRTYAFEEGLNNLGIYKVIPFNDSILAASSNNGLILLNINTNRATNYFEDDGLQSSSFEETSGIRMNNYILFGGINGFTKIEPRKYKPNKNPPRLFFSDIRMEGDNNKTSDTFSIDLSSITISNIFSVVTVNFSALSFIYPEKVSYEYMLSGVHKTWVSLGNKQSLSMLGVNPGRYRLFVRAINEDGVLSNTLELDMDFRPMWYQTNGFLIAIVVLVSAIAFMVYRYRLAQLRKEENIRKRIASDLHDDIGSTLNSIKVYVSLALQQENIQEYLLKIKQGSQEAITGLRDVIWVLDDKQDTIEQLAARIVQFFKPLCEANGIVFKSSIDPDLYGIKLGKEEKRNIYLVLKESINNSIKYSEASEIQLSIQREASKLQFTVKDNGKGFDNTRASNGNGLRNIQSRAKQSGFKASIQSAPGEGTSITLSK